MKEINKGNSMKNCMDLHGQSVQNAKKLVKRKLKELEVANHRDDRYDSTTSTDIVKSPIGPPKGSKAAKIKKKVPVKFNKTNRGTASPQTYSFICGLGSHSQNN